MKNLFQNGLLAFVVTLVLASCGDKKPTETTAQKPMETAVALPENFQIIVGKSVGNITANMTHDDILKLFGKDRVTIDTVLEAEGTVETLATFVDKGKATEIIVKWADSFRLKRIDRIQVGFEGAPYTLDGLKIGSTIADLERVNGKPMKFSGFGWDYGGYVTDFGKGKFDGAKVLFNMDLSGEASEKYGEKVNFLMGEGQHSSADKNLAAFKNDIRIQTIELNF